MPLYEYVCNACGEHTELVQSLGSPPLAACPRCGGPVQKVLAPPALQFKGSGWYVTDYGRGGNGNRNLAKGDREGQPTAAENKAGTTPATEKKDTSN